MRGAGVGGAVVQDSGLGSRTHAIVVARLKKLNPRGDWSYIEVCSKGGCLNYKGQE